MEVMEAAVEVMEAAAPAVVEDMEALEAAGAT